MKKKLTIIAAVLAIILSGCSSVPVTGRKQILLVSDSEVLSSSLAQYNDYIKTAKKSTSAKKTQIVTRVGKKIAAATEEYLRTNGLANEISNKSIVGRSVVVYFEL